MSRSPETNEFASSSCSGSDPYRLMPRGSFDCRLGCIGLVIHQVVGGPRWIQRVSPVASSHRHLGSVEREHPAQVPAGESENTWLQCVEHGQQQVCPLDLLDRLLVQLDKVGEAERGGDHARGRAGNAIGSEEGVVRTRIPVSRSISSARIVAASSAPVRSAPRKWKSSSACAAGEMHKLIGQLIVILQAHAQERSAAGHCRNAIFMVSRRNSVSPVARAWWYAGLVTKSYDRSAPRSSGVLDVVDRQVQFLEGEAADLPDHAGDHLIRGLRQWMSLRPGGSITLGALLQTEEAVGVQPQRTRTKVAAASASRRPSPAACRRWWGPAS